MAGYTAHLDNLDRRRVILDDDNNTPNAPLTLTDGSQFVYHPRANGGFSVGTQGIDFFRENSLLSERDIVKEIERYLCNPGQATSYMVGQQRILSLRDKARAALGAKFDIRAYHDVVLREGALPLDVLTQNVDAWIAAARAT